MMTSTYTYDDLATLQKDLLGKKVTCEELVHYYLKNIESTKTLNAYIEVFESEALEEAKRIDRKITEAPETLGKLFGMVTSIKDVLCYEGHGVTAASQILEGFESLFSATAIQRLKDEDVIFIGRVNCDQFGMGSTNENSVYGPVLNPNDPTRVAGGSSGGSAVAVKTDTCLTSLGTDTGGSVRQPAGFCGVLGFKPTYGRISRYGLLAYASSFDQIGILARNMEPIARMLEVMAGKDPMDGTSSPAPVEEYSQLQKADKPYRIAYYGKALASEGMAPEIRERTFEVIESLKNDGHIVSDVDFDYLDFIIPAYYVLTTAEASSNLSRYDGIKFGKRNPNVHSLQETYVKTRTEGFGEEVKRRIMLGTFVLSSGYYNAYYNKAQKVRRLIKDRTEEILNEFDFILMPVSPLPPFKVGEKVEDPVAMYLADVFTVQANMAGIPAVCFPTGNDSAGLPIGIQLMSAPFKETQLMSFGHDLMKKINKAK